jgi:hypothetical protein
MTLAAILAISILSLGWFPPSVRDLSAASAATSQSSDAQPPQVPQQPAPPQPSTTGQAENPTSPAKPTAKPRRHHKKASVPDCSNSPTALDPAPDSPAGSSSTNAASANTGSTNSESAASKPCPPPKKVVRNGGSDEPAVQLTGGTAAARASQERSTADLTAAAEENLKKISGRQLNPSQQEIVNQIQQFVEQSKKAVVAGDLERAHNLALKAHLLSVELVKP